MKTRERTRAVAAKPAPKTPTRAKAKAKAAKAKTQTPATGGKAAEVRARFEKEAARSAHDDIDYDALACAGKYERCIQHVKLQQSKPCMESGYKAEGKKCYNPYAICNTSVGRKFDDEPPRMPTKTGYAGYVDPYARQRGIGGRVTKRRLEYCGEEDSPLGRGYSAMATEEGRVMKGRDGRMYIVERYRSGKYEKFRWVPARKA